MAAQKLPQLIRFLLDEAHHIWGVTASLITLHVTSSLSLLKSTGDDASRVACTRAIFLQLVHGDKFARRTHIM